MKKILLATTLIAASAGFAAAEVAVSGTARMGVADLGTVHGAQFNSRIRIIFTASGETDGGLSFGGSVRNDQSGVGNTANGDSTVYISGAFGKLTMGDTGNAADALVGQVSGVGYTSLNSLNELPWIATPKTGALYEYSAGALTFALGSSQVSSLAGTSSTMSAAAKYATDAYSIALGYEDNSAIGSQVSVLGSAAFSGATIKAKVANFDSAAAGVDAITAYALSVDYAINGVGLTAFYSDNGAAVDPAAYGIGASYDLGGGASVVGGIVKADAIKNTMFDLGVKMSF
ncbi:MAG: porin [Cypionkella sp.]|uniref:porin n=1 Tax=Cypionkella sp. TaxID=2811411 RepID=UPI002724D797|nr:porin [Cypionkella sp.]MDO8325571.1 porin [Cypionkella sp.]